MVDENSTIQTIISEPENVIINSGAAYFSNKMYATMQQAGMRLTFAEINHDPKLPAFRCAIFLQYADAHALRDLLNRQLAQTTLVPNTEPETKA